MKRIVFLLVVVLTGTWARAAEEVPRKVPLYVLPLAFSPESKKNYGPWIERLTAEGLGNAIWQEIEEVFYEHPRFVVLQSPVTHEEFQKILSARAATATRPEGSADTVYALPEKVITVNTNFFTRAEAKLAWGTAQQRDEFHVTVYLRYYDLVGGRLNVAVPAQADATGSNPVLASRQATRAAVARLIERLGRAPGPPKAAAAK
jgi:hypothetical protein